MASVIKAGNATDGVQVTSDNTGILELKTGTGSGTTAVTIGTNQAVTFAGAVTSSGNQTVTGNLTVNGNTTLGDANTDTILMTAAPSIGGAGLGMGFGFRNRIINGAMVIDQRNAGASVTQNTSGIYTVDRFAAYGTVTSKFTIQRSTTAPAGFINSALITSSSAYSVTSSDQFVYFQAIEGLNVADLGWGTANAQAITVSFWVRSSLTGTFGGSIRNSGASRSYPFSYTISAANTWEQKTVTIAGDTSGTWLTDNSVGMYLTFSMGSGSTFSGTAGAWSGSNLVSATGATSVVGTNGATFYITGVQLEKGSTATSFDYRPYGTELQLCQRYYQKQIGSTNYPFFCTGFVNTSTRMFGIFNFPQPMRATPTLETTGTASNYMILSSPASPACTGISLDGQTNNTSAFLIIDASSGGLTAGQGCIFRGNNTSSAYIAYSSEL